MFVISRDCIYDESRVPEYQLPSALDTKDGERVSSAISWCGRQRNHVLKLFESVMYGELPPRPDFFSCELLSCDRKALQGLAIYREIRVHLGMKNGRKHFFDLLLFQPAAADSPVPVFLALNFWGNHTCSSHPDILVSQRWMRQSSRYFTEDHYSSEDARGCCAGNWPVEEMLHRGYAFATVYYGDFYPDGKDQRDNSIYSLFDKAYSGGAISAWAWGLSRAMDCLETIPTLDHRRVAVLGHSRLGKTALWAGAQDERFALVISNCSGCAGAALSRRKFGEVLECFAVQHVDYWCTAKMAEFYGREEYLPVDQHMLLGLIAPRPLYVASATEDLWADPKGEYLAAVHAGEVYRLFGSPGLGATEQMPAPDTSIGLDIGYHIRTGSHDLTEQDWQCYLDFADRQFALR